MATRAKGKYWRKKIRHPVTGEYKDVYAHTRTELADKCAAIEAQWAREIEDEASPYFFQYAADWYARTCVDMTPDRRAAIAREINSVICPVIGQKKLRDVTSDDVLDVMLTRKGLSRSAQEKTLQVIKRILRAAENAGKIARSPASDLKPGGAPARRKEALTRAQQAALLDAVAGLPVELFVRLGLYAGLRREEICGLCWRDVHLDHPARIDVRQACRWTNNNRPEISGKLKSAAAWRTVPVPPPLLEVLQTARAEAAKDAQEPPQGRTVLSTAEGGPWSYQTFRRAWGAIEARTAGVKKVTRKDPETGQLRTVEIERMVGETVPRHPDVKITLDFDVTPHILRHTYVTELILGGVNVKRVQYLAGHESSAVTMDIYAHVMGHRPEDLIDDVSAIFPG